GSDTTLVSQKLTDRLNLTGKPSEVRVTTITGSQVIPGRTVALEIRSLDGEDEVAVESAHSVPTLRMKPPVDAIRNEICTWPHLEDVPFGEVPDKMVSILIGNDVPEQQPYAVKTPLGWILLGPLGSYERGLSAVNCLQRADVSIAEQIKRLYSAEFADTEKFTCPRSMEDDSALLQDPDLTADLVLVMLRFRKNPDALAADIEEIIMQVGVPKRDRGALRFLWWPDNDVSADPVEYQMVAHPFGATSSPFCASYALRRMAEDFGSEYDGKVAEAIANNFYVDDCLISLTDVEKAKRFVPQTNKLVVRGGFRLRKWISNILEALCSIPESDRAQTSRGFGDSTLSNERMLGTEWNPVSDVLRLRFQLRDGPLTRRGILSSISSIFDPLGLVFPLILPSKVLLQKLCKKGLGWDDPIQPNDAKTWNEWLAYVLNMNPVEVPRCITRDATDYFNGAQLHVFSDASETGYGAVTYARLSPKAGQPYCTLVIAKSRVTPMKTVTIPRLELNVAVLAVKNEKLVSTSLRTTFESVTYWADSAVVLHYINNTSTRFSTFVANRVATIHEGSLPEQWKHVRSTNNPADLASCGIRDSRGWGTWSKGPAFLQTYDRTWPRNTPRLDAQTEIEIKGQQVSVNTLTQASAVCPLLSHFSDWFKLLKSIAWLSRFKSWLLEHHGHPSHIRPRTGSLAADEIKMAKGDVIRMVQHQVYLGELLRLSGNRASGTLKATGQLQRLCPVLIDSTLCVGGHHNYSSYAQELKHPAILPNKHPVVDLIVRHFHTLEGHSGPAHVLRAIRKYYWIVHGGSAVKRIIGKCISCRKQNAVPCDQQMAPLPAARVEAGWFPFEQVGVD
ncbi:uncharacterized protein DEA37_0007414, partial [Paragonimus westermani]